MLSSNIQHEIVRRQSARRISALPTCHSATRRIRRPGALHAITVDVQQVQPARPDTVQAPSVATESTSSLQDNVQYELDPRTGLQRLKFDSKGWQFWDWTDAATGQTYRVHYVQAGQKGPPVVLVHGYGASAYHWRYTIPALAKDHRVFAVDMLGFGWSEKAIVDYTSGGVWSRQLSSFISQVVGGERVVLVGNSLGAFASMATAAANTDLVQAVAILNGAGPFEDATPDGKPKQVSAAAAAATAQPLQLWWDSVTEYVSSTVRRGVLYVAFVQAKQPARIRQVLELVYANRTQLDDDLVESIEQPARDPMAAEVFYLVNSQRGATVTVNSLLRKMGEVQMPLLLLWGDLDPWMVPSRAAKIMQLYPAAQKVSLQSGHCPHDDTPAEANAALLQWLSDLPQSNTRS